jgi:hypothetical protein
MYAIYSTTTLMAKIAGYTRFIRGRLISKADWRAIDCPKKQTEFFPFYPLLLEPTCPVQSALLLEPPLVLET